MTPRSNFWEALFPEPAEPGQCAWVEMRLLHKDGRPFLLLPGQSRPAAATLELYPAQTSRARAARTLLRWLLRASLPLGTAKVALAVSSADLFVKFLAARAGAPTLGVPTLGILAGNPASDGQRLLVLVFDARQQPVAVVKVGLSPQAKGLIEKEASFLGSVPTGTPGVPKLRATFESPRLRALALDFFPGDSPRPQDEAALPPLLESWVDPNRTVAVSDTLDWARLEKTVSGSSLFPVLAKQLCGHTVGSALHHGDLAPWNIRVSPAGSWTVLDWERGELTGIPGWDWFHYVIQSAILVGRLPTPALIQRVDTLLNSAAFRRYAARAGIVDCVRELVLAYLLHTVEVIKPSEGLPSSRGLMRALAVRWQKG